METWSIITELFSSCGGFLGSISGFFDLSIGNLRDWLGGTNIYITYTNLYTGIGSTLKLPTWTALSNWLRAIPGLGTITMLTNASISLILTNLFDLFYGAPNYIVTLWSLQFVLGTLKMLLFMLITVNLVKMIFSFIPT